MEKDEGDLIAYEMMRGLDRVNGGKQMPSVEKWGLRTRSHW